MAWAHITLNARDLLDGRESALLEDFMRAYILAGKPKGMALFSRAGTGRQMEFFIDTGGRPEAVEVVRAFNGRRSRPPTDEPPILIAGQPAGEASRLPGERQKSKRTAWNLLKSVGSIGGSGVHMPWNSGSNSKARKG